MISFQPTEDQKLMLESVAQFARTALRPKIRDFEKARELPESVRRTAHELGLGSSRCPSRSRVRGSVSTAVLLEEEIAYGDPAARFALGGPGAFGLAVVELGTEEQAKRALAPFLGADGGHARFGAVAWGETKRAPERARASRRRRRSTATAGGSTAQKAYVLNADRAERFVVFAQVEEPRRGLGRASARSSSTEGRAGPRP